MVSCWLPTFPPLPCNSHKHIVLLQYFSTIINVTHTSYCLPAWNATYFLDIVRIIMRLLVRQALISGAFSIMRQASMLGLFPKTTVIHTGHHVEGQIYMPEVNYALMVLCVVVTAGFQSTKSLGEAYGE